MQELAQASGLTEELVRHWFSTKASLPQAEQTAAAAADTTGPRAATPASEPQTTGVSGSSPLEPQQEEGKDKTEQSACEVAKEVVEEKSDKTVNPTKGRLSVFYS